MGQACWLVLSVCNGLDVGYARLRMAHAVCHMPYAVW